MPHRKSRTSKAPKQKTEGLKPALKIPPLVEVPAIVANWAISGKFDKTEVVMVALAVGQAVIAYFVGPGKVIDVSGS